MVQPLMVAAFATADLTTISAGEFQPRNNLWPGCAEIPSPLEIMRPQTKKAGNVRRRLLMLLMRQLPPRTQPWWGPQPAAQIDYKATILRANRARFRQNPARQRGLITPGQLG